MLRIILRGLFALTFSSAYGALTVFPSRQEISLPAGAKVQGEYVVKNESDQSIVIKLEFRDWFVLPKNSGIKAKDWLSIVTTQLKLGPQEEKPVQYEVKVPTSAEGVLVAMLSFLPQGEAQVSLMLSVSLYVTVAGTEKISWQISDVNLSYRMNQLQISAKVWNHGNVHVRPQGMIEIYKGKLKLDEFGFAESRPVYPENSRLILARKEKMNLLPGKYRARIHLRGQGEQKEKEISFRLKKSGEIILR